LAQRLMMCAVRVRCSGDLAIRSPGSARALHFDDPHEYSGRAYEVGLRIFFNLRVFIRE